MTATQLPAPPAAPIWPSQPVPPGRRRVDPRLGALVVLSLAAVTAFAVLVSQLVLLSTPAYAASDLALTGPLVRPGDDPLDAIRTVLTQQSEALLRGDRAGYLQAIPADRQDLRAEAGRRFDSLTALDVRRWDLTATTSPERDGDGWRQVVGIGYCFAADDCLPVELRIGTQWSVARGRLQLIGYEQTTRPWDTGTLTAKRGARVTVAGPADDAQVSPATLDLVLGAAEAAAPTDDRFATSFDGPPQRYFVYVAGDAQWQRWYDHAGTTNAAAYAMPLQPGATDVILDVHDVRSAAGATLLLTHEFAHVVTLNGVAPPAGTFWLTEGIAEYIADGDGAILRQDLPSVRTYVASGRWDGTVNQARPAKDGTLDDAIARYGIALLAVRYLAQRHGEAKLLAFFTEVVRRHQTLDAAARSVFGADWPAVSKDAAAAVRAAATGQPA
ncbi:hypothetical protein ACFPIJ_07935 [Dactylosporangium cerinum]|uniref:Peptidase MA-like domain-containing protein n=1 Tax=Dactylosporangium cerinum TaxID=1434730 RepID=A0ABV9VNT9_9ACTN